MGAKGKGRMKTESDKRFTMEYEQGCGKGACIGVSWDDIMGVLLVLMSRGEFTVHIEECKERDGR